MAEDDDGQEEEEVSEEDRLGKLLWEAAGFLIEEDPARVKSLVEELKASGSGPDVTGPWACCDGTYACTFSEASPLHVAAIQGHLETVKALLDCHASADFAEEEGKTALMLAAAGGHGGVVRELLSRGASPTATESDSDRTALFYAVSNGSEEAALVILEVAPLTVRARDSSGNLPLHVLNGSANLAVARALVRSFPEALLEANEDGLLPLHTALGQSAPLEVLVFLHTCCPAAVSARCPNGTAAPRPCENFAIEDVGVCDDLVKELVATCFDPAAATAPVRSAALQLLAPLMAHNRFQKGVLPEVLDWAELISGAADPLFHDPRNLDCLLQLLEAGAANGDFVWSEGDTDKLARPLADIARGGRVGDDGTAAALLVLLHPSCPAKADSPLRLGIVRSAVRFLESVRRLGATEIVRLAWSACEKLVARTLLREFPDQEPRRVFALGLLSKPGVLHDASSVCTMVAPPPARPVADGAAVSLVCLLVSSITYTDRAVPTRTRYNKMQYDVRPHTVIDHGMLAAALLADPAFAFAPLLSAAEAGPVRRELARISAEMAFNISRGRASCVGSGVVAGAAGGPDDGRSLPENLGLTLCAITCLLGTRAEAVPPEPSKHMDKGSAARLIVHLLHQTHLVEAVRLMLTDSAASDGRSPLGEALRASAAGLARVIEWNRSTARAVSINAPPPAKRVRLLDEALGATDNALTRRRPVISLAVHGWPEPFMLIKELWLPHLSADSVVRAGILRDDALAGDASGSGGSGGGGSSSSMADPHVNDTIPFCSLMAGADGIAGLVLPEEKGKYFRAVARFILLRHEGRARTEGSLRAGNDAFDFGSRHEVLRLYAMAAYLGVPDLMNECFSRLDLLDADTLDAVCHIAMERPKPHDGPTVSKCAVQLLLTARTRAPFGVSGAVVAAVAEEAQAALKSLSQSM